MRRLFDLRMKITLEVPDHKAAFVLELLNSLPFVKTTQPRAAKPKDDTEYLFRSQKNRERLEAAMQDVERGQTQAHDLLES